MPSINPFVVDSKKYPLLGFRFEVNFTFSSSSGTQTYTSSFQSISGISRNTKITKIADGGDNYSEYHLPSHHSFKDVTLKRGIIKTFGENYPEFILDWFEDLGWHNTSRGKRIWPCMVQIILKDTNSENNIIDVCKWTFSHAYPTSVVLGEFNAQKAEIALETVTLGYSKYERETL